MSRSSWEAVGGPGGMVSMTFWIFGKIALFTLGLGAHCRLSGSDDMVTVSSECIGMTNGEGFLIKNVREGAFIELRRPCRTTPPEYACPVRIYLSPEYTCPPNILVPRIYLSDLPVRKHSAKQLPSCWASIPTFSVIYIMVILQLFPPQI